MNIRKVTLVSRCPVQSQSVWRILPEIYAARRQPLQPDHIQSRQLVPCQTESLHTSELLQDGRDAAETVEGQAEVGETLQRAELLGEGAQKVTVQEESLQAEHKQQDFHLRP